MYIHFTYLKTILLAPNKAFEPYIRSAILGWGSIFHFFLQLAAYSVYFTWKKNSQLYYFVKRNIVMVFFTWNQKLPHSTVHFQTYHLLHRNTSASPFQCKLDNPTCQHQFDPDQPNWYIWRYLKYSEIKIKKA